MFANTLRWNDGVDESRYWAVEIHQGRLLWYRWSHQHGVGREVIAEQSSEDYRARGAPLPLPDRVAQQLAEAIDRDNSFF